MCAVSLCRFLKPVLPLQMLERIKAEIAAIKADPELSEEEKKEQAKNKMQALYAASGCAKVKGALEQVERALQEGNGPALGRASMFCVYCMAEGSILEVGTLHVVFTKGWKDM